MTNRSTDIGASGVTSIMGTERYRPYPAYKDSGVEWLGEIPAHWEVKRLKSFATVQLSNVDKKSAEGQDAVRLSNYVDVYYNERIDDGIDFMPATATTEQIRRFSLRTGDVLITKDSETWTDIAVPAVVSEDLPGVLCGYHLAHIRPDGHCDGRFLSRVFAAVGPCDQYHIAANGITRFGLTGDSIRAGVFAFPPLHEQRAIAAFLDRETAKIDALVAKKERLIELLQEKRTALVSHAVTKGLDPDVPLKDSGVEWLGEIPAHWEVKKLKHLTHISSGFTLPQSFDRYEGKYPVYGSNGRIGYCDRYLIANQAIVIGRVGASGTVNVVPERSWISDNALIVRIVGQTQLLWLRYILQAANLGEHAAKNAQPIITATFVGDQALATPANSEQRAIAAFLDRETANIDALIAKVQEAIDRLKELRTALIAAAVTGKIDVREAAA